MYPLRDGEAELEALLRRVDGALDGGSGSGLAGESLTAPERESRGHSRAVVGLNDLIATLLMGGNERRVAVDQPQRASPRGPRLGRLRPDVAYTDRATRRRVNVEVDTVGGRSHRAQARKRATLQQNDPRSTNVFVDVDRGTGRVRRVQIFRPGDGTPSRDFRPQIDMTLPIPRRYQQQYRRVVQSLPGLSAPAPRPARSGGGGGSTQRRPAPRKRRRQREAEMAAAMPL